MGGRTIIMVGVGDSDFQREDNPIAGRFTATQNGVDCNDVTFIGASGKAIVG